MNVHVSGLEVTTCKSSPSVLDAQGCENKLEKVSVASTHWQRFLPSAGKPNIKAPKCGECSQAQSLHATCIGFVVLADLEVDPPFSKSLSVLGTAPNFHTTLI